MYGVCDTGDGVEVGDWLVVKKRRRNGGESWANGQEMGVSVRAEQSRADW
jgi:hypothetical protein